MTTTTRSPTPPPRRRWPAPVTPLHVYVEDGPPGASFDTVQSVLCEPCATRRGYPLDARLPWTPEAWAATVDADPDTGITAAPDACQDCGARGWEVRP